MKILFKYHILIVKNKKIDIERSLFISLQRSIYLERLHTTQPIFFLRLSSRLLLLIFIFVFDFCDAFLVSSFIFLNALLFDIFTCFPKHFQSTILVRLLFGFVHFLLQFVVHFFKLREQFWFSCRFLLEIYQFILSFFLFGLSEEIPLCK